MHKKSKVLGSIFACSFIIKLLALRDLGGGMGAADGHFSMAPLIDDPLLVSFTDT